MGKLKVFEVVFEGDDYDLFKAGDVVEGYVRIVLSEPKQDIRGIAVEFVGKAKTGWSESEKVGDETRSVRYYSTEKYFEDKLLILGKDKTDESKEKAHLDAGEHKFPFKFRIPSTSLPHPLEGLYGRIRYKVKAKIDRPWKFDHTTQRLFSVVGVGTDLNTTPSALVPSRNMDEETVCCLCCATGPIKVSAETDKGGYVPGETIWVSGFVDNQSSRDIVDITAKLIQIANFSASREGIGATHSKEESKTLTKIKGEGCEEYSTASFDRKPLVIPPCPPSGLPGCNIMHIKYFVEFEADVSGTPFDASVYLPITIGTVPVSSAFPPGEVITQQPSAQPAVPPPPSYEVALGGPQEIPSKSGYDYTFGKLMYAPRYPYYNFPPASDPAYPLTQGGPAYPPPQGDPAYAPPQGDPAYAPPQRDPAYAPPQGDPAYAPPQGDPSYAPPQGDPALALAQGDLAYAPPQGDPANASPQGYPACAPPQGDPTHAPPQGDPAHESPQGDPAHLPPQGDPAYAPPQGDPAYAPPQGEPAYAPPQEDTADAPPSNQTSP